MSWKQEHVSGKTALDKMLLNKDLLELQYLPHLALVSQSWLSYENKIESCVFVISISVSDIILSTDIKALRV